MKGSMYNKLVMMALTYGAMFDDSFIHGGRSMGSRRRELSKSEKDYLDQVIQRKISTLKLKRGCKEFSIDGITIIALNEKNAIRKINNLKERIKNAQ